MSDDVRILVGDCRDTLRTLPDGCVQTCVTSPPYFGLRDYGTGEWGGGDAACDHLKVSDKAAAVATSTLGGGKKTTGHVQEGFGAVCGKCGARRVDQQIGLEPTPDEFVAALVDVFREIRRVLRDDGTVWINLGDSYNNRAVNRPSSHQGGLGFESEHLGTSWRDHAANGRARMSITDGDLKEKDLLGVPWMVAFALRADGWYLRSDIIWSKPNPMPESVTDRPTKAHEYVFLLSKGPRYFYDADAIREDGKDWSTGGPGVGIENTSERYGAGNGGHGGLADLAGRYKAGEQAAGRNKRSVWTVATQPYPGAHFATFPPKLIEPCILAGSSPKACGVCGAPWRRVVERVDKGWDGSRYGERAVEATGGAINGGTAASTLGSSNGKLTGESRTVGWQPSCAHHDDTGRSVVLDPFAGSGTTGAVALEHGRAFIGSELNPDYAGLMRDRLLSAPLALEGFGAA